MSTENPIQKKGWLRVARIAVMWRLNTGKAWLSGLGPRGVHRMKDGSLSIAAPRPISVGLGMVSGEPVVGAADLIGRTTIRITPEMVGKTVAVFTSLEAKRSSGGVVSEAQKNWRDQTLAAGGIAGVFSSPEEAESIVLEWCKYNGAELL